MIFLIAGILIFVLCGISALVFTSKPIACKLLGAGGTMAGSLAGLFVAFRVLISGIPLYWHASWQMPFGSVSLSIDALSAFFLIPLFILSFLGALYASEYLDHDAAARNLGLHWLFYNFLVASMALVLTSSSGLLFIMAWEMMSLASFFLVLYKHDDKGSREAAWIYLIATHIGAAFLLAFFIIAASQTGSFDFDSFAKHSFPPAVSGLLFALGLVGFGSKAGFVPFHVWLPKAHPAAPSHVSALMSGVMIKMGIYGIMRSLVLFGPFQEWWGLVLVSIGCVSGILGVLLALGQHDLKRLLAFSSVENIGIISLCMGAGILGACNNNPLIETLGFFAALLHVVNHAFFKGLLFLGAGAVLHAAHTTQIDKLGGLIKKMPFTAFAFLIGSVAICGLPVLNGFVSEFMLYMAGFFGLQSQASSMFLIAAVFMTSLALIGGLATACFTKAFGSIFLGEPRSQQTAHHDVGLCMRIPMYALASLCAIIGLFSWLVVPMLCGPLSLIASSNQSGIPITLATLSPWLKGISLGCALFIAVILLLILLRKRLLKNRVVSSSPTWDCGFSAGTPRIQYTGSSFTQPVTNFFRKLSFSKQTLKVDSSIFPQNWTFESDVPDAALDKVYLPGFKLIGFVLSKLKWLQGGKVHVYVLYIVLTLIAFLTWNFLWAK